MAAPTLPISKDVFGHWAVVATIGLVAALVAAIPALPGKKSVPGIPPATAAYREINGCNFEEHVPALMKCEIGPELEEIDLAMDPPLPPVPAVADATGTQDGALPQNDQPHRQKGNAPQ